MAELKRIGKYEIIKKIGHGGLAVVYKARDPGLEQLVGCGHPGLGDITPAILSLSAGVPPASWRRHAGHSIPS
jgi:serine/threonine protein kinase